MTEERLLREVDAMIAQVEGYTWRLSWDRKSRGLMAPIAETYLHPMATGTEPIAIDYARFVPGYSTNHGAAMNLMERHRLACIPLEDGRWAALPGKRVSWEWPLGMPILSAEKAPTPMLAICRAVLNKANVPIPPHLLPLFEGRTE